MADQIFTGTSKPFNDSEPTDQNYSNLDQPAARAKSFKPDDDLISSLQNRPENRRARQVFEWETARRAVLNRGYARGAA